MTCFLRVEVSRVNRRFAFVTWLLLAASASAQPAATPPQRIRNHFDSDAHLGPPSFFDFVVLGAPGAAEWKVVAGRNPFSSPNQAMQVVPERPADSIAAAVRRNAVFRDGTWSVAILQAPGRGGLLFRMADEKNFCVLLVNLVTGDARLIEYEKGKPVELASSHAAVDNPWGLLSITARGPKITATWDGKTLLEATASHPVAGSAGLATAGPGIVAFDEFILDPSL
jgi:hypothetical protein